MSDIRNDGGSPNRFPGGNVGRTVGVFLAAVVVITLVNFFVLPHTRYTNVDFSTFKSEISAGVIKRVEITPSYYLGFTATKAELQGTTNGNAGSAAGASNGAPSPSGGDAAVYRTNPVDDPGFVSLLDSKGVEYYAVTPQGPSILGFLLTWIAPLALILLFFRFTTRRMGNIGRDVMSIGQNKSRVVAEGSTGITFEDVAGADEAKEELTEVVDFLKNPERYHAIGGKIPKGVLLVGPPGTGKTLLARAVAGEAGVTFFRISGSEFVEMFVGVGAARVRDLFKQAREKAPCIVFVDELDAIGKSRAQSLSTNDEREQTLNQLLVEMDGFDARTGVIVLAATNRPEVLDPALLRPGRFDRHVLVDKPDLAGREMILSIHSRAVRLDPTVDLNDIARKTAGFVGADLANLVNEAAIHAVRAKRETVSAKDFETAFEKLVAGLEKRTRVLNPRERSVIAHHETGHALVARLTTGADPVEKISIVPRGIAALGYTLQLPTEDRYLMTQAELLGRIDVLLGGRAAEQLVFGEISTGAANDLEKATEIARRMITEFGMSSRFRNVHLSSRGSTPFLNDGVASAGRSREYSEATQQYVDEETAAIINARYNRVLDLLGSNASLLREIAEKLLEVEVLDRHAFEAMANDRDLRGSVDGDARRADGPDDGLVPAHA